MTPRPTILAVPSLAEPPTAAVSATAPARASADDVMSPTCPLCHAADVTVTEESVRHGAWWRCTVCGQAWTGTRLETVAAYARFVAIH